MSDPALETLLSEVQSWNPKQQEALAGQPVLREQGQGHAGGFAGAGGGLQEGMTGAQGGAEFVQDRVNRQVFAADGEGHVNGRGIKGSPSGWPPGSARRGCRSAPLPPAHPSAHRR